MNKQAHVFHIFYYESKSILSLLSFSHNLVSHITICYSHSFTIVETPKQSKKVRKGSFNENATNWVGGNLQLILPNLLSKSLFTKLGLKIRIGRI